MPEERRRRLQHELFEEEWDPYAATPEDALDAARREVKRWRLEQLTHLKANADLDPGHGLLRARLGRLRRAGIRLRRGPGGSPEPSVLISTTDIIGRLAQKKGSNIVSVGQRPSGGQGVALGPPDGSRSMIDAIHHAANVARSRTLDAAREMLYQTHVDQEPRFFASLKAVLEVLPVSRTF